MKTLIVGVRFESLRSKLKDLKLAQFEIMQKETQLLKILENQN